MVISRAGRGESGGSIRSYQSEPSLATPDSVSEARDRGSRVPSLMSPHPGSLGSNLDLDLSGSTGRNIGSGTTCSDENDSITVVVRVRPINEKEIQEKDPLTLKFPGEGQVWTFKEASNPSSKNNEEVKKFAYNVVFEPQATQQDILEHSGVQRLMTMAVDGFSCTVFCYGQTGSGKTHTLTGPPNLFENEKNIYSESQGLIFRCFVFLFEYLESFEDREFTIKASFLEIYNEKIIDLLNVTTATKPLQVRWNKKMRGFFVENQFSIECYELDDLCAVLEEGLRNRAVATHNMNEYSSRSHTILTVEITSEQKAEGIAITKIGKINFVDLAGSEMTKKTNSEGKTLEEANNINKSLLVLGTCISTLSDPKKKDGHVPYRDSKLTKLLADSLAGAGVTLMIACISPARSNLPETLNTLRYASRAKKIRTKPIIIMDPKEKLILQLKREVSQLLEENQHLKMLLELNETPTPPGMASLTTSSSGEREVSPDTSQVTALALAGTVGNSQALLQELRSSRKTSTKIDENKLKSLDPQELISLVKKYVNELGSVRKENKELQMVSLALVKDQEQVAKQNERLQKKIEDYENGTHRSPIGSARSVAERWASMQNKRPKGTNASFQPPSSDPPQYWVNPINDTEKQHGTGIIRQRKSIPDSINKELEKRRIGRSMTDLTSAGSNRSITSEGEPHQLKSAENSVKPRRKPGSRTKRPNTQPRSKSVPRTAAKAPAEKKGSGTKKAEKNQKEQFKP